MQNRYVGDSADFAKCLILKHLRNEEHEFGIVWYAVNPAHVGEERDGTYLKSEGTQLAGPQFAKGQNSGKWPVAGERTVENSAVC